MYLYLKGKKDEERTLVINRVLVLIDIYVCVCNAHVSFYEQPPFVLLDVLLDVNPLVEYVWY